MKKNIDSIKNVLTPKDSISIVVVIIGIAIAVFISETEIKLIGISVSILGAVSFFMSISQRLKDHQAINNKTSRHTPNLKIVETKEGNATRQTIEDLDDSLDKDYSNATQHDIVVNNLSKAANKLKSNKAYPEKSKFNTKNIGYEGGDEGFRIVKKGDTPIAQPSKAEPSAKPVSTASSKQDSVVPSYYPEDDFSSVRIVKKANKEQPPIEEQVQTIEEVSTPASPNLFDIAPQVEETTYIPNTVETKSPEQIKAQFKKQNVDLPVSLFMDDDFANEEPRNEFVSFVSRALMVIRSIANTTTAAFFLVNNQKRQLVLETFVTEVPDAIADNPKIQMGEDILSQITLSGKPEILTQINPDAELDLLPYYKHKVGSKSFIGMPIYYHNSILGVICADTKQDNAYDKLTAGFMGHFTKLIANMIVNYAEKYELQQDARILKAISNIRELINNGANTYQSISDAFIASASEIFDFQSMGVITYDFPHTKWFITSYVNKYSDTNLLNKEVNPDEMSMISEVINNRIDLNLSINKNSHTRVHHSEDKLEQGYFVATPLVSSNRAYGVIFVEAPSRASFTSNDLQILKSLSEQTAVAYEQIYLSDKIVNTTLIDKDTGVLNMYGFVYRLHEELHKAKDFSVSIILASFKIDNYDSYNPTKYKDRFNKVADHILSMIMNKLTIYDLICKSDDGIIYVALIGSNINNAQLWAEGLRNSIANNTVNIDKKRLSVTISCGIAKYNVGDNANSLLDKSEKALEIACKRRNNVTVYG